MISFNEYLNTKQNAGQENLNEGLKELFANWGKNKGDKNNSSTDNVKKNTGFFAMFMGGFGFGSSKLQQERQAMMKKNEEDAKARAKTIKDELENAQIAKMKAKNSVREAQKVAKHNARLNELKAMTAQYTKQENYYKNFNTKHPGHVISDAEVERVQQSMDAMMSGLESGQRDQMQMFKDDFLLCLVDENGKPRTMEEITKLIKENKNLQESVSALCEAGESSIFNENGELNDDVIKYITKETQTIAETNSKLETAKADHEKSTKDMKDLQSAKDSIKKYNTDMGKYYDSEVTRAQQLIARGNSDDIEELKKIYDNADEALKKKLEEKIKVVTKDDSGEYNFDSINQPLENQNTEIENFLTKFKEDNPGKSGEELTNTYKEAVRKFNQEHPTLKGILKDELGEFTGNVENIELSNSINGEFLNNNKLDNEKINEKQTSNIENQKQSAPKPSLQSTKPKLELSEDAKNALETIGLNVTEGENEMSINELTTYIEDQEQKIQREINDKKKILDEAEKRRHQIETDVENARENKNSDELQRIGIFTDVEDMDLEPGEEVDSDGKVYVIDPITNKKIEKPSSTDSEAISNYENVRKLAILSKKPEKKKAYTLKDGNITYTSPNGEEKTIKISELDKDHPDYKEVVAIIKQDKNNSKLAAQKEHIIQEINKGKNEKFQSYLNQRKEQDPEKFSNFEDDIDDEEFLDNIETDPNDNPDKDDEKSAANLQAEEDNLKEEKNKIKDDFNALKDKLKNDNLSEEEKNNLLKDFKDKYKDSKLGSSLQALEVNDIGDWWAEAEKEMDNKISEIVDKDDEANDDDKVGKSDSGKPIAPKRKIKKVRGKRKGTFRYYVYDANGGRKKGEDGKPMRSNEDDWKANQRAWAKYKKRLQKWESQQNESLSTHLKNNINESCNKSNLKKYIISKL